MTDQQPQGILDDAQSPARVDPGAAASRPGLSRPALRRLGIAGGTLVACIGLTYAIPGLASFRPVTPGEDYVPFWNIVGREWLGNSGAQDAHQSELAQFERLALATQPASPPPPVIVAPPPSASVDDGAPVYPAYSAQSDEETAPKTEIEAEDGLKHFFRRLTLAEMGVPRVLARVGHWGDSVIGDDGVTHAIRTRMQARFGDGGHGFHLLGRYNLAYRHLGIRYRERGSWSNCQIIFKCQRDGRYGYGGVSSQSSGGGTSKYATTSEGLGSSVSQFGFWYAKHPAGGKFQIKVDEKVERVVDTRADELGDGVVKLSVPDGSHKFEVRAIGGGVSRGYGVTLERDGPGVVWDGLSLIGSFTQRMDYQDPEHIANQIRLRQLDLMVFMFGGNDVQRQTMDLYRTMQPYEDEYTKVIRKFRKGRPKSSCLIMSLVDHGERVGRHGVRTRKIVPRLVESQRRIALAEGCAFFNTFEAMGGDGSVERWYHATPQLMGADFGHPTSAGHQVIASLFYQSLMHSYGNFRREHAGLPFPEHAAARETPSEPSASASLPKGPADAE